MKIFYCRCLFESKEISFEFSSDNLDDVIAAIKDTYGLSVQRIVFYELSRDLVRDIDF